MATSIIESGMVFGPFDSEKLFHIEKSKCYKSIEEGVQISEFVFLRQNKIWIVEAKQSSPRKISGSNFIAEVKSKLENSINLMLALKLGRFVDNELSDKFTTLDWSKLEFKLVLVIKGHQLNWLPQIKDCLNTSLLPVRKTLNLGSDPILVLNDDLAIKHGIVERLV